MAVKQKVVDCISPTSAEARLQIILRALQDITAQGLQDKMCAQIVISLGTVHVPTDPKNYMQFISDIKSVKEILTKECSKYNLIFTTLKTLYNEISHPGKQLSPAMSIVLQLIDVDFIPRAVDMILQSGYTNQSLKNAFLTLCVWLTKWTWTENLGPVVLALMKGLEAQQHHDILYEVTLLTIEQLFKLLIVPEPRNSVGPIVVHMLNQTQRYREPFVKIVPLLGPVILCLKKENSESSLMYLHEIVNLSAVLVDHVKFESYYPTIKSLLEPYLPVTNYKQTLDSTSWPDGVDSLMAVQTSIGKVGLNNLGNTCYMNSVLQALFMTKSFRNQVLLHPDRGVMSLFTKLQTLFALLQHSSKSSLSPNDILNLARPPGFLPGHQHDSSEFLGYLLDMLHEQEKTGDAAGEPNAGNSGESSAIASTVVQSVFGGRTVSESRCGQCGTKSERVDNFRELQLSFPNNSDNQSVQELLGYYLQPEKLSGENQYHCDVCHCLTDGERVTRIEEAPPRLILTLKHFRYDPASQQRTKLLQSVKLDNQIVLEGGQYELYAAVVHCGSSVDSGHYYTFAKDGEDWYRFNDGSVMKSISEELHGLKPPETPYILFYSRQDCLDPDNVHRSQLSSRLQSVIHKDNTEYESEKRRRPLKTYNTRQNHNDEPPPPGCGGSPFSNNSSNMYVC